MAKRITQVTRVHLSNNKFTNGHATADGVKWMPSQATVPSSPSPARDCFPGPYTAWCYPWSTLALRSSGWISCTLNMFLLKGTSQHYSQEEKKAQKTTSFFPRSKLSKLTAPCPRLHRPHYSWCLSKAVFCVSLDPGHTGPRRGWQMLKGGKKSHVLGTPSELLALSFFLLFF